MDLFFSQEPKIVLQNKKFRSYVKYLRSVGTQYSVTQPSSTKKSETPVLTHQLGISSCTFLGFCREVHPTKSKLSKWKDFLTRRWRCWSFINVLNFVGVIQILAERLFLQKRWQLKTKSIKDSKFCLSESTCCECVFKRIERADWRDSLYRNTLQARSTVHRTTNTPCCRPTLISLTATFWLFILCMWPELWAGNSFATLDGPSRAMIHLHSNSSDLFKTFCSKILQPCSLIFYK